MTPPARAESGVSDYPCQWCHGDTESDTVTRSSVAARKEADELRHESRPALTMILWFAVKLEILARLDRARPSPARQRGRQRARARQPRKLLAGPGRLAAAVAVVA